MLSPLDTIPIFAKAGAIIPMQEEVQYIENFPSNLILDIYPEGESSFTIYEDDGRSLEYTKGIYAQTEVSCSSTAQETHIQIAASQGEYQVPERNFLLQVHRDKSPSSVSLSGKEMQKISSEPHTAAGIEGWYFDQGSAVLYVHLATDSNQRTDLSISY